MPDWRIHSPRNLDWQCHLADCSEEHAESVMAALRDDPHCPEYLELENLTPEPEPELESEPQSLAEAVQKAVGPDIRVIPPKRKRFWRRNG